MSGAGAGGACRCTGGRGVVDLLSVPDGHPGGRGRMRPRAGTRLSGLGRSL